MLAIEYNIASLHPLNYIGVITQVGPVEDSHTEIPCLLHEVEPIWAGRKKDIVIDLLLCFAVQSIIYKSESISRSQSSTTLNIGSIKMLPTWEGRQL